MNRPWMPLYVADYLADTAHLNATESGAYLHLIMHYWMNGGLPTDDKLLARVARMTLAQWRKARPLIEPFFMQGWKHKRIEFELTEAARISAAGKAGGKASGEARRQRLANDQRTTDERSFNDQPNDQATKREALHLPSLPKGRGANAPPGDHKTEFFRRGREVLGKDSGAFLAKLLRSFGPEDDLRTIAKARARVEEASTKDKPIEWLGRVMAPKPGEFKLMSGIEGVV